MYRKSSPPASSKLSLILFVDLFQGLDTVGGKGRRHHGNVLFTLFGQRRDMVDGIGLQPFLGAKDGLEGGGDLGVFPAQAFLQQARRFLATGSGRDRPASDSVLASRGRRQPGYRGVSRPWRRPLLRSGLGPRYMRVGQNRARWCARPVARPPPSGRERTGHWRCPRWRRQ